MSAFRDFVVLCLPRPGGERFAIFRPEDWVKSVPASTRGTHGAAFDAIEHLVEALEPLEEAAMRARLLSLGLGEDAVARHLARARLIAHASEGGSWEHVTAVGHRNEEGQEVVAATSMSGREPPQRLFRMRCTVCGHEYGTSGCDIPRRICPRCQDGPPGEGR